MRNIKKHVYLATTIIAVLPALLTGLNAESLDHDGHHQEAHLHGLVEMTLAIEDNRIELSLESPAANIVGFEHPASTPEQQASVTRAKKILNSPEQVLTFIGTRCESSDLEVNLSSVSPMETDHAETHHKEGAHNDHQKHTNKSHEDHQTHSEISAHYQFQCDKGTKLTAIKVHLFDLFPRIETVHAAWVSESKQAQTTLTADSITINLEGKR